MISAAPDALEFANSLATLSSNRGAAIGTSISGCFLSGSCFYPWVGAAFRITSLTMFGLKCTLNAKKHPVRNLNNI